MRQSIAAEIAEKRKFDRATPDKGTRVHINEVFFRDGTCRLSGTLVDVRSGRPRGVRLKRVAHSMDELTYKENQLYNALVGKLHEQKNARKTARRADRAGDTLAAVALERLKQENIAIDGWNEQTLHTVLTYFERHFLPFLHRFEDTDEIGRAEVDAWKAARIREVLDHGRSLCIPDAAAKTVTKSLKQCLRVYERLRELAPELPVLDYFESSVRRKPDMEHVKSLPEAVRQRFCRMLEKSIPTEPAKVFAAVLMCVAALRTGEAAAVYPSDVRFFDGWAMLPVLWQDKEGYRSKVLKTQNSYRVVPLCRWACMVLQKCAAHMDGFDLDSGKVMTPKRELSEWILGQLRECGCDASFLREAQRLQEAFPDKDVDQSVSFDLAAYILRRDAASRMRNVCGFTAYETDCMLGHKPSVRLPKGHRPSFRTAEELYPLAQKMERYLYDPAIGYPTVSVSADSEAALIPFSSYRVKNDTAAPMTLRIDLEAAERGEAVSISAPRAVEKLVRRSVRRDIVQNRTVIGGAER